MPPETLNVQLRNGLHQAEVLRAGTGEPLLYLHGAVGHKGWAPFLDRLAQRFSVYAPYLPGYSRSNGLDHLQDVLDLTLYQFELMDALGLVSAHVAGHFLGGMVAAEMAVLAPNYVRRLVLVAPAGLWRDDAPVADFLAMNSADLAEHLWPARSRNNALATVDREAAERARELLAEDRVQDLTAAGKFLWPIPDKGLKRRAYRIKAPALLVWGEEDRLNPSVYAEDFARMISGAQVSILPNTGHLPMLEEPELFADTVITFLTS